MPVGIRIGVQRPSGRHAAAAHPSGHAVVWNVDTFCLFFCCLFCGQLLSRAYIQRPFFISGLDSHIFHATTSHIISNKNDIFFVVT
jgi:hypothetical protein